MPIHQHQPQQTKANPRHLAEGQLLPKLEQSNQDWLPGDLAMEAQWLYNSKQSESCQGVF